MLPTTERGLWLMKNWSFWLCVTVIIYSVTSLYMSVLKTICFSLNLVSFVLLPWISSLNMKGQKTKTYGYAVIDLCITNILKSVLKTKKFQWNLSIGHVLMFILLKYYTSPRVWYSMNGLSNIVSII